MQYTVQTLQKIRDKLRTFAATPAFGSGCSFAMGVLLSWSKIGAWRPFGIAYGLAARRDSLLSCAGAFLGSICAVKSGGVMYASAIMICFSCRMVLRDTPVGKLRGFMPLCILLSVFFVKAPAVLPEGFWSGTALALEALVAAGMWLVLDSLLDTKNPPYPDALPLDTLPMSGALEQLGNMLASPVPRTNSGQSALEWAFDSVCASCKSARTCWKDNYTSTRRAAERVRDILENRGALTEQTLPDPLQKCPRKAALCHSLNHQYENARARETARKKQQQGSTLMKKQFDSVAMLLRDAAYGGGREEFLSRLGKKADPVAKSYRLSGGCRVEYDGEGIAISLPLPRAWHSEDNSALRDSLTLALGCSLDEGEYRDTPSGRVLSFCIGRRIGTDVVSVSRAIEREKVCGDCCKHLITSDRRQIVILSDGMGTGEGAARLSTACSDAIIGLVQAGVSLPAAARALTGVLEANVDSSGFATLDMVEIDLFSGQCVFVKFGAQPSYIVRGGKVQRIWKQSLPAGLGGEGAVMSCMLDADDMIIMMTDGAKEPDDLKLPPRQICMAMTSGRALDDMTAAVITVSGGAYGQV
ncbi:MAG: SpoIIE family protein phosphatase [Clostridia bacterium]|nr:SpoIIE family protein phosphatase [Clostridia bacterium]